MICITGAVFPLPGACRASAGVRLFGHHGRARQRFYTMSDCKVSSAIDKTGANMVIRFLRSGAGDGPPNSLNIVPTRPYNVIVNRN